MKEYNNFLFLLSSFQCQSRYSEIFLHAGACKGIDKSGQEFEQYIFGIR